MTKTQCSRKINIKNKIIKLAKKVRKSWEKKKKEKGDRRIVMEEGVVPRGLRPCARPLRCDPCWDTALLLLAVLPGRCAPGRCQRRLQKPAVWTISSYCLLVSFLPASHRTTWKEQAMGLGMVACRPPPYNIWHCGSGEMGAENRWIIVNSGKGSNSPPWPSNRGLCHCKLEGQTFVPSVMMQRKCTKK